MSNQINKKTIFILGCERSGSTWLSNIFDSHSSVNFIMEPFSPYVSIFSTLPARNIYISSANNELVQSIVEDYKKLYKAKYCGLYKPGKPLYLKEVDRLSIKNYQLFRKFLHLGLSRRASRYHFLNLNTVKIPIKNHIHKNPDLAFEVIKELRLNFKVNLLAKIFCKSKYIVAIRHPGVQISSIKKLFQEKRLIELRRALLSFEETMLECNRFKKYYDVFHLLDIEDDIDYKLALWWMINYEVLIEDLKNNNLQYIIIEHEKLCNNPEETIIDLFRKCDLSYDKNVATYLDYSTKNDNKDREKSPVNTTRNSSIYYKQKIQEVSSELNNKIQETLLYLSKVKTLDSTLRDYLKQFYSF